MEKKNAIFDIYNRTKVLYNREIKLIPNSILCFMMSSFIFRRQLHVITI